MLETINRLNFNVAIYIRLSKEDVDRGYDESESIINQRSLLVEYVEKLGDEYKLIDIYIDQGYTGTNFNRPAFQRMKRDIEEGKINMVITKDLSRLGRDYIETGEYIEKWFPENNIRYVSVMDGIDTFSNNNGNNDIAPFKSILNDMYSKDLSKKVRAALHTMQKQGKWVGSKTALGYMQDPNDKNHLVICEEEARIVKVIFDMAIAGNDVGSIRRYLEENKIPTYSQVRYNKFTFWENRAIKNILRNEVYIGNTVQNKRNKISYKNRKIRINPENLWCVVENTHEPIIDKDIFNTIQKMIIVQKYNRDKKKHNYLLDGLLVCYDCKHKIGVKCRRKNYLFTVCNHYRRNSKLKLCTPHGFSYKAIEKLILQYIRELFLSIDSKKVELNIKNAKNKYDYEKILKKIESEINVINDNIDKMYVDKLNNKISQEMYERLFNKLTKELEQKEKDYNDIEKEKNFSTVDQSKEIQKVVKDFLKLENPTPEIMKVVVNRIEIHQDRQIDIIFNFKRLNEIPLEMKNAKNIICKNI